MNLRQYTARQYANTMQHLLPQGLAWKWPLNGLGDTIFVACAQALARIDLALPGILKNAIDTHRPAYQSWHLDEYRRVANEAVVAKVRQNDKGYFGVGSRAGDRLFSPYTYGDRFQDVSTKVFGAGSRAGDILWSSKLMLSKQHNGFTSPLLQVDHFIKPFTVGSRAGDRVWGSRSRVILRVRYFKSMVDPLPVFQALMAFKQAHVFLYFEDITSVEGKVNYAQE